MFTYFVVSDGLCSHLPRLLKNWTVRELEKITRVTTKKNKALDSVVSKHW